jgi:hypothetical protein
MIPESVAAVPMDDVLVPTDQIPVEPLMPFFAGRIRQ